MFTSFIVKVIYIYLMGFVLAVLEIQIEGRHGWADKLPTWRPKSGSHLQKLWHKLFKKDLTGYHASLMVFLFLFFHIPFIWSWSWSLLGELEVLAFFMFFAVFWDFLWFVLNPHYSLRDFGSKQVWWHRKWIGRIPVDYIGGILFTILLFIPIILTDPSIGLIKLAILLGGISVLTITTVIIYPKAY